MAQPIRYTLALASSSATIIALPQQLAAGASFTLNGGGIANSTFTADTPRRILITSLGNDSSNVVFSIFGLDRYGNPRSESLAGANAGNVQSVYDYLAVTKVVTSATTASGVEVGTSSVASTPWVSINRHVDPGNISLGVNTNGTVTVTAELTFDDPNQMMPPNTVNNVGATPITTAAPVVFPISTLSGISAPTYSVLGQPANMVRMTLNSGSGSATFYVTQAGLRQGG